MNASMTGQSLICNQGIYCLNSFNAADAHEILHIRSKTDFTHCTWHSSVIAVEAAMQGVWSVSFQPFFLAFTHRQQLHMKEHLSLNHPSMTCNILLLLIKRYNLYTVLACSTTFFHLTLSCVIFFQFRTFNLFISSKTSSSHRVFGLPVGL